MVRLYIPSLELYIQLSCRKCAVFETKMTDFATLSSSEIPSFIYLNPEKGTTLRLSLPV